MVRRGKLMRKSNGRKSCCPTYALWCDAENYRFTRAQKKVLRALNSYIKTGKASKDEAKSIVSKDCRGDPPVNLQELSSKLQNVSLEATEDSGFSSEGREDSVNAGRTNSARRRRWQALQDRMAKRAKALGVPYEALLREYRVRRQRRLDKNRPKDMEEYLNSMHGEANQVHNIDIRVYSCSSRSPEFETTLDEEFRLYLDYQVAIHNDSPDKWTRDSYIAYLVDTPLMSVHDPEAEAFGAPQFGTYHQQYWLDGEKLIAVGVVDLVPGCLASVYFFYDPVYAFLHLGTYSALREIAFVRYLHRTYGPTVPAYADFMYYNLGFYVHSCEKMLYKDQFLPSYLSCPETFKRVPIERCQRLLDKSKQRHHYNRCCDQMDTQLLQSSSHPSNTEVQGYVNVGSLLATAIHPILYGTIRIEGCSLVGSLHQWYLGKS
ncbi:Arginyl-tRNA--protein transferase 1 [Taenia crassiceps]|uniref:Arginyl-tRNA--protein transferase 1 n=1 Tax=Taenia crassiceps TaxID=6207 RepID=A0ABR4QQ76_9CEST